LELRITEREPFADGHPFEGAGPYERLVGRAHFAVDPDAPAYADVVDLDKVRRNAGGLVEYATDVCMLKPVGPGNRRLFFGYGNRGNKRELQFFNDAPASNDPRTLSDAGNGFLIRRGYAVVWAAWEGDLLPGDGRMLLDVPVARDGADPLTGLVRSEFIADGPGVSTFPLSGWASTRSYPTVSRDTAQATLTRRRYPGDAREPVASDRWAFARTEGGVGLDAQGSETALVESDTHIHVFDGFEPGWIYELVYTACDPRPYGIGHAVVRDLVSFLRYEETDGCGVANPFRGAIDKAYAWGRSQTGRCIRDFVYRGYNADARGRRVFDGLMPTVAGAGRGFFNHRFASPTRTATQHLGHLYPVDLFPFTYGDETDPFTGRTDGLLRRARAAGTVPRVMHVDTSSEYWHRGGSLVVTDPLGERDAALPSEVRVYVVGGAQHRPARAPSDRGQVPVNPNDYAPIREALFLALDRWVSDGVEPPPSVHPRIADGTLAPWAESAAGWRPLPGVSYPTVIQRPERVDYGDEFESLRRIDLHPPRRTGERYGVRVPALDADNNERGVLRLPRVAAPVATYTGWNLRNPAIGAPTELLDLQGGRIPFARTVRERERSGDPRHAVTERYADFADYRRRYLAAAEPLIAGRYLLPSHRGGLEAVAEDHRSLFAP
jgi:hypothetical protein